MEINVQNILLYVDDAVRYNAVVSKLAELGRTYKTIAASTHTPTSFGSMLTGLHPPSSGILSFEHKPAPGVHSIFDIEDQTVTMAAVGGMNRTIARIFNNPPRATIEELEPPFVHVVRRPGGHAPYDGFEWTEYEYQTENAREYLYRVANDPKKARREYYQGVETSFEEFERVHSVLQDRGLTDDTLIIYTSDHGELLGEHGFFGHTHLATPEIVYVPTALIHPELPTGQAQSLFHHVDLLPTIKSVLQNCIDIGQTEGTAFGKDRTRGYNHFEHVHYGGMPKLLEMIGDRFGGFDRSIRSVWDRNGGYAFVDGSRVASSIVFLGLLSQTPEGRQLIHNRRVGDLYSNFVRGSQSYGSPNFSQPEAIAEIKSREIDVGQSETEELDETTIERLQSLGYM